MSGFWRRAGLAQSLFVSMALPVSIWLRVCVSLCVCLSVSLCVSLSRARLCLSVGRWWPLRVWCVWACGGLLCLCVCTWVSSSVAAQCDCSLCVCPFPGMLVGQCLWHPCATQHLPGMNPAHLSPLPLRSAVTISGTRPSLSIPGLGLGLTLPVSRDSPPRERRSKLGVGDRERVGRQAPVRACVAIGSSPGQGWVPAGQALPSAPPQRNGSLKLPWVLGLIA